MKKLEESIKAIYNFDPNNCEVADYTPEEVKKVSDYIEDVKVVAALLKIKKIIHTVEDNNRPNKLY